MKNLMRQFKDYCRRQALVREGIAVDGSRATFTAGERSGVWTVVPELLDSSSIVYSFGVGDNLSLDLAMVEQFGLELHAFDPTPYSIEWVHQQNLPGKLHFHPIGVADFDGTLPLALPNHGSRFNFRQVTHPSQAQDNVFEAPVKRISTLMQSLGHTRVDLVKLDIEGGEYAAIQDMLNSGLFPQQLLVEFHHHFRGIGLPKTLQTIAMLKAAGYLVFHISARGLEIGFARASVLPPRPTGVRG